ncbi:MULTISPECIES: ribonuclease III [unclassified Acinetobacter]|uniref:ribonuclease III n=1 Tax=unclassified Acinetobacter TaxID=196816 RepID=UPI0035B7BA1C
MILKTLSIKQKHLLNRLGYQFKQIDLFKLALTHRSISSHNYERLEFLGDALLSSIIAKYLYDTYPKEKEGKLSRMRATLVCQDSLAKIAKDLQLGQCLILGSSEAKSGGHHRESILADVVEALIGAIFLDSDQDYALIERLVLAWYAKYLDSVQPHEQLKDPKTRLQEFLQARKRALPVYTVEKIIGESPNQHFTVHCHVDELPIAVGESSSRRYAEQAAAAEILKILESV